MDKEEIKKITETITEVAMGNFNATTPELEKALHLVSQGNGAGNAQVASAIKHELERRQKEKELEIAKKGVSWQKIGVIAPIIFSLAAIIISIIALLKP